MKLIIASLIVAALVTKPGLAAEASTKPAASAQCDCYNRNLATAQFHWGRILDETLLSPAANGRPGLQSDGPWFIDTNHRESSLLVGPAVIWTGLGAGRIPGLPNLTKATIRVASYFEYVIDPRERNPTDGGRLVFWFQSRLPPAFSGAPERIVNYAFKENLLPGAFDRTAKPTDLQLTDSLDDWTCLGRNQMDVRPTIGSAAKYTCALNREEFRAALSSVNLDMGLLLLLPKTDNYGIEIPWQNASAPNRTPALKNSRLWLKEFSILRDQR